MIIFADRVKNLLNIKGMKQAQLAETLGISPARLNAYLSGKAEAGYTLLATIATALHTSTDYLLGLSADFNQDNYPDISIKYAGMADGQMFIDIPVFRTGQQNPSGTFRCNALLKSLYVKPYMLKASDNSMAPHCAEGDLLLVAPRTYIPPVINNLNPNKLYAVRRNADDSIGTTIRHCLTKEEIIFLRPSVLEYETLAYNLRTLDYCPVAGIIVKRITAN